MKVKCGDQDRSTINYIIANLVNSNLEVKMFHSVEEPQKIYYIVLDMPLDKLEQAAEAFQYPVKMAEQQLKFKYF
jgi:hypothetical protein